MKRGWFFLMVAFLWTILPSCSLEKKATKAFLLGKYQTVIDLYQKPLSSNPRDGKINYFIAESYRLSNRLKESEPYFEKASGRGIDKDTVKFFYAQALKSNGKYDQAREVLTQLSQTATEQKMKDRAQEELRGLDYIKVALSAPNYYKVKNLESLNTASSEYSPFYLNNELFFTSSRGEGKIYEAEGKPYTNIFKASTRGAIVDAASIQPLPEIINDPIRNEGSATFTPDGKTMVFARGNTYKKKGGGVDVDLYISRFRNGVWSEPVPININTVYKTETDPIAKNYSWDSTPCFSPDGRTLYFASNRPNGFGGTDIYMAQMDARGRFTRIRNMGPEINTPGDEMFPYMAEDGKFYFASDAHPGFGGLDLFVVNRVNGKNSIDNLGQPMNSNGDDFGLFHFKADRGFFTSNRNGGKGDDDVYTFVNEDPNLKVVNYYLQGITYSLDKEGNKQVLPNTKVNLLDGEGNTMLDYVTGNDGKFLFRVYGNEDYQLLGELDGYITKRQPYTTRGKTADLAKLKDPVTNITFDTLIVLDKKEVNKIIVLENIYFDFDKSDIRSDAAIELDKLAQLLVDNPEIKIEMGSHTDSVGSVSYNHDLSQRRAESTVKYLINKGIAPERLAAKGYGEIKPIARNTNPDGTDNPLGRNKNRRTEFKILEVGALPKDLEEEEEEFDEDKFFKDNRIKN